MEMFLEGIQKAHLSISIFVNFKFDKNDKYEWRRSLLRGASPAGLDLVVQSPFFEAVAELTKGKAEFFGGPGDDKIVFFQGRTDFLRRGILPGP